MAKTACEELAHYLEGHYRADVNLIGGKSYASQAKRLRSEARELKECRKEILAWWLWHKPCEWTVDEYGESPTTNIPTGEGRLAVLASRIQKARKSK